MLASLQGSVHYLYGCLLCRAMLGIDDSTKVACM